MHTIVDHLQPTVSISVQQILNARDGHTSSLRNIVISTTSLSQKKIWFLIKALFLLVGQKTVEDKLTCPNLTSLT